MSNVVRQICFRLSSVLSFKHCNVQSFLKHHQPFYSGKVMDLNSSIGSCASYKDKLWCYLKKHRLLLCNMQHVVSIKMTLASSGRFGFLSTIGFKSEKGVAEHVFLAAILALVVRKLQTFLTDAHFSE